jgi:hypothetical protein
MKKVQHILTRAAIISVMALGLTPAIPVFAADAPASQPGASTGPLKVYVVAVDGFVNIRRDESAKWEKAAAGMVFGEGTEVKTGPHSAVQLKVDPNQTVTLDRLGSCKIARAMFEGGKVTTDVVMPYGRVRYDVEAAGVEHDCKVHTPSSTLAIRGTQTIVYDQPPFAAEHRSLIGRVRSEFAKHGRNSVGFGGADDASVTDADNSPTDHAMDNTILDPGTNNGRTPEEVALIAQLQSQNGIDYTNITPPRPLLDGQHEGGGEGGGGGGHHPPPRNFVTGDLLFTATWMGTADIDLFVGAGNRTIAQKNLGSTRTSTAVVFDITGSGAAPSVGHVVGPDSMGNANEQTNTETIRIGSRIPVGTYNIGAFFQSDPTHSAGSTDVHLNVQLIRNNTLVTLTNADVSVSKDSPKQTRGAVVAPPTPITETGH